MIPYRVSVWAPSAANVGDDQIKLYGTYADCDDDALSVVADVIPEGWRVDRIAGLMSRTEVERLSLTPGDVCELPGDAEDSSEWVEADSSHSLVLPGPALHAEPRVDHAK